MTIDEKFDYDDKVTLSNIELVCPCGGSLNINKDIWPLKRLAPDLKEYVMTDVYVCPKCHGNLYFKYTVTESEIKLQLVDKIVLDD